jgi:hypothetical protein
MGLVTPSEGNKAAQIAADTDGVVKVIKLYQYIKDDKIINQEVDVNSYNRPASDTANVPSQEVLSSDTIEVTDL